MEEQDKKDILAQYMEKDAEILGENGVHPRDTGEEGSIKNRYWKFVGSFLAIIILGLIAIPFIADYIKNQEAQTRSENITASQAYMHDVQEQLKNDKDGGTTPEETLKMFIAALKDNDIKKAKLYYSPYPEKRSAMFKNRLDQLNKEGKIVALIALLEGIKEEKNERQNSSAWFSYIDNNKSLVSVELTKAEQFSDIWKIESLAY